MPYKSFSDVNSSAGFQELFIYVNDVTGGLFSNMILFTVFIVVLLGVYFSQKRQTGNADLSVSFAVAGWFVTGLAIIMTLIPGMLPIYSLVVCFALSVLGALWLYMSRSGE